MHAGLFQALPQETLWAIWDYCPLFDLVRVSRVSTSFEASVFAFVAERRLHADAGVRVRSGKGVVQLLTWWLHMARSAAVARDNDDNDGGDDDNDATRSKPNHAIVVECWDVIQRGAVHAWARRFGCASERASYAHFRPQHVYACGCGLVSPLSALAWSASHYDTGYARAKCKQCRSVVTASHTSDLDELPATNGDPAWTSTHNAVVLTADPRRMPLSVGPSVSGRHRPGGRAKWAEQNRAPADDAKTDDQIKAWVAYAFGRSARWLPLDTFVCATRGDRLFSVDHVSGLRHTPRPSREGPH